MKFTAEMFADLARSCHDPDAAEKAAALLNGDREPDRRRHESVNHAILRELDVLLETYGIEPLDPRGNGNVLGWYLNTGDTYALTVYLSGRTGRFRLTSWGDVVERRSY